MNWRQYYIQFMYLGEGQVCQNRIREFIRIAKDLQVKDISEGEIKLGKVEEKLTENAKENEYFNNGEKAYNSEDQYLSGQRNIRTDDIYTTETEAVKYPCNEYNHGTEEDNLQTHIQSQHEEFRYPYDECDYQTAKEDNLLTPIQSQHEDITYPCNECDYQATTEDNLQKHIQSVHEGINILEDLYDPPKNEAEVFVKEEVKEDDHVKLELKGLKRGSSPQCTECGVLFNSRGTMLRHYKSRHQGLKHACNECDKQYLDRGHLSKHIQSVHEGIKYPCDLCDYLAPMKASLRRHIKVVHESVKIKRRK